MENNCQQHIVESPAAMGQLAGAVSGKLRGGDLLLLSGDLGAGKTTFVQGLAVALGVKQPVTSPTFTIVAEYDVVGRQAIKRLVHVDLYRLEKLEHSIQEALEQSRQVDTITAIEWAEKLPAVPRGAIRLRFAVGAKENQRQVEICYPAGDTT